MKTMSVAWRRGFTLIELLVVISIMAILAALTLLVLNSVKGPQYTKVAEAELAQIACALDEYKAQYGVFPPSNPKNPMLNPLYYELLGVTNSSGNYVTLDQAASVPVSGYASAFNVAGAINCAKAANAENGQAGHFLTGLPPNRIGSVLTGAVAVSNLVTSVGGPDQNYMTALQNQGFGGNPFHYLYPGTNNPGSYDLWIDLSIKGKTNRISNWSQPARIL